MATSSVSAAAEADLAALIATQFSAASDLDPRVLVELCGSADPAVVAKRLMTFVETALATEVVRPWFFTLSVGSVVACELADERVVVAKVHSRRVHEDVLAVVHRVQRHLVSNGFPAPNPIAGPSAYDDRWATIDEWLDDRGHDFGDGAMRSSAAGLARMIELARDCDGVDTLRRSMMSRPIGSRYPEPHSPRFDFSKLDPRVGAIDALADAAIEVLDSIDAPEVIAHGDWSARNVRFGPDGLRGVYDWDSLGAMSEPIAVGIAAATWRSLGEPTDAIAPDPGEVAAYCSHYEAARRSAFSTSERLAIHAQALYALCYTARCEISLGAGHPVRAVARLEASEAGFRAAIDRG